MLFGNEHSHIMRSIPYDADNWSSPAGDKELRHCMLPSKNQAFSIASNFLASTGPAWHTYSSNLSAPYYVIK